MMERAEVLTHVIQSHSCAVTSEGGVKCWGRGTSGEVIRNFIFLRMFVFALPGDYFLVTDDVGFCSSEMTQRNFRTAFGIIAIIMTNVAAVF